MKLILHLVLIYLSVSDCYLRFWECWESTTHEWRQGGCLWSFRLAQLNFECSNRTWLGTKTAIPRPPRRDGLGTATSKLTLIRPECSECCGLSGANQPPQPAEPCVSSLNDAKRHAVHEMLPRSPSQGAIFARLSLLDMLPKWLPAIMRRYKLCWCILSNVTKSRKKINLPFSSCVNHTTTWLLVDRFLPRLTFCLCETKLAKGNRAESANHQLI